MTLPACQHHEDINSANIGTCRKCGRVVQYPWTIGGKMVILKEGRAIMEMPATSSNMEPKAPAMAAGNNGETATVPEAKRGRLTREQRRELLQIGPEAYAAKYGYSSRGISSLKKVYGRHTGKKPVPSPASAAAPEMGPAQPGAAPKPVAGVDRLPRLVAAFLQELPADGEATLSMPRIDALSKCFEKILIVVYGED